MPRDYQTALEILGAIESVSTIATNLASAISSFRSATTTDLSGVSSSIEGIAEVLANVYEETNANGGLAGWESDTSATLELVREEASNAARDIGLLTTLATNRFNDLQPPPTGTLSLLHHLSESGSWSVPPAWGFVTVVTALPAHYGSTRSLVNPEYQTLLMVSFGTDAGYTDPEHVNARVRIWSPAPIDARIIAWECLPGIEADLYAYVAP